MRAAFIVTIIAQEPEEELVDPAAENNGGPVGSQKDMNQNGDDMPRVEQPSCDGEGQNAEWEGESSTDTVNDLKDKEDDSSNAIPITNTTANSDVTAPRYNGTREVDTVIPDPE